MKLDFEIHGDYGFVTAAESHFHQICRCPTLFPCLLQVGSTRGISGAVAHCIASAIHPLAAAYSKLI